MYARVSITTDTKKDALVIPSDAIADLGGRRGVFQVLNEQAVFRTVQVGSELPDMVEILGGLNEGEQVVTTGARALRDGDRVLVAGGEGGIPGRGGRGGAAGDGSSSGRPISTAPAPQAPAGASAQQRLGGRASGSAVGAEGRESATGSGGRRGRRGGTAPEN
jgi:hypothetical protein